MELCLHLPGNIKRTVVLIIISFFQFSFAQENRIGFSLGMTNVSEKNPIMGIIEVNYERRFYEIHELSFLTSSSIGLCPFVNFYALNIDLIAELNLENSHNIRFIYSPLFLMDFGKLISNKPWINYCMGVGVSWLWEFTHNNFLDLKIMAGIPIYELEECSTALISFGAKMQF